MTARTIGGLILDATIKKSARSLVGQKFTAATIAKRTGHFVARTGFYTAGSVAVQTGINLYEQEIGDIPDEYEPIIHIVGALLLGETGKIGTSLGSSFTRWMDVTFRRLIASVPRVKGLGGFFKKQTVRREYGVYRDVSKKQLTLTNHLGMPVYTLSPSGMRIDKRYADLIARKEGSNFLRNLTLAGGASTFLTYLTSPDSLIPEVIADYLGLISQSITDAAGEERNDAVGLINIGGAVFKDVGALLREYVTNARSLLNSISIDLDIDIDKADDIVISLILSGKESSASSGRLIECIGSEADAEGGSKTTTSSASSGEGLADGQKPKEGNENEEDGSVLQSLWDVFSFEDDDDVGSAHESNSQRSVEASDNLPTDSGVRNPMHSALQSEATGIRTF